eukprot:8681415-Pyramimonas_sp.AAC.1
MPGIFYDEIFSDFFRRTFLVPRFDRTKIMHWILSFAGEFAQELCFDDHFGANSRYRAFS